MSRLPDWGRAIEETGGGRGDADVVDNLGAGSGLGVRVDGSQAHDVGRLDGCDCQLAAWEADELAVLLLEAEVGANDVAGSRRADREDDSRVDVA